MLGMDSLLANYRREPQEVKTHDDDACDHVSSNVIADGEATNMSLTAAVHFSTHDRDLAMGTG